MVINYTPVVLSICPNYGVNPNWVVALIEKESHGNPWVTRYERDYEWIVDPKRFTDPIFCNYMTEYQAQKTSWGLGQIMGALSREQGHKGLITELLQPELNITHMCIRIKKLMELSSDAESVFAMYNGGPGARVKVDGKFKNQQYVDDVCRNLQMSHL